MTDRLTPEREAEIRKRAPKRTAEFSAWINRESPFGGQDTTQRAETVLEEDVPALLAELDALRKERDEIAARVRNEIADDVHRAELPTFAATENPVLVAKVVRAVDVRLVDMGYAAPYFVTKGGAS